MGTTWPDNGNRLEKLRLLHRHPKTVSPSSMTPLYLTIFCSAESGGRPKIPGLNAASAPCPPNSPTDPAVPSVVIIGTVIISYTKTTTAFTQPIYSPPRFIRTYRPIQSAYHPLTSGFSESGRPLGSSGMPSYWTAYAKAAMDAADHVRCRRILDSAAKASRILSRLSSAVSAGGGLIRSNLFLSTPGTMGTPNPPPPPSPLLLLGSPCKIERERESGAVSGGEGGGVQGDVGG